MRTLYTSILLYMCLVFACTSFAQSSCDQQITINVRDSRGEFVSDLQAFSFHAKVGGHEAFVTSAAVFAGFSRVILVLDASASMSGDGDKRRWNAIKNLTEQIVYFAPASTKLALLVFNKQTIRKLDFGHSRKELLDAVEQIPDAHGLTALWDSLLETSEMLGDALLGDAVLVISDFGDSVSKGKPEEVRKRFVAKGVRVFGIGIYDHYFATEEERLGPEYLRSLAEETGGLPIITDSFKDVPNLLKQLFEAIGRFYVLKINPSPPLQKPERLNLSLIAGGGKKNKGISLYYPRKISPCTE